MLSFLLQLGHFFCVRMESFVQAIQKICPQMVDAASTNSSMQIGQVKGFSSIFVRLGSGVINLFLCNFIERIKIELHRAHAVTWIMLQALNSWTWASFDNDDESSLRLRNEKTEQFAYFTKGSTECFQNSWEMLKFVLRYCSQWKIWNYQKPSGVSSSTQFQYNCDKIFQEWKMAISMVKDLK